MATGTETVFDVSAKPKTGTPYDDAFRTLLVDCPELVIPLINETFGEHYVRNENT